MSVIILIYLCTKGSGRKLSAAVVSSPQSSMIVVDLNFSTLQGRVGWPDRQYWNTHTWSCAKHGPIHLLQVRLNIADFK